jgi:hypothetical protein
VRNQVILVDIPYASLTQPEKTPEHYRFEFIRENIRRPFIGAITGSQELGSSSIQIWDFEIYRK